MWNVGLLCFTFGGGHCHSIRSSVNTKSGIPYFFPKPIPDGFHGPIPLTANPDCLKGDPCEWWIIKSLEKFISEKFAIFFMEKFQLYAFNWSLDDSAPSLRRGHLSLVDRAKPLLSSGQSSHPSDSQPRFCYFPGGYHYSRLWNLDFQFSRL